MIRFARGVYVQSDDDLIWRGLWVTFDIRQTTLVLQPNASVFCPVAEELVSKGLRELYATGPAEPHFGKLGLPVLTRPLYQLVRDIIANDRKPPDYHITSVERADEVTALVRDDFERAGRRFLNEVDGLPNLRDQLIADSGWRTDVRNRDNIYDKQTHYL
jgi:hypothetical protein